MIKVCDLDVGSSALHSIKAVSEHLAERIKLELPTDESCTRQQSQPCTTSSSTSSSSPSAIALGLRGLSRTTAQSQQSRQLPSSTYAPPPPAPPPPDNQQQPTSMNNNLMFRSMFFMNDEARHFLAPALPIPHTESDYFQKKVQTTSTGVNNVMENHESNTQDAQVGPGGPQQQQQPPQQQQQPPQQQQQQQQVDKETSTMPITLPKSRPHTCEECGKSFLMKHHLATHMRVHTGERPHVCPECGKSFALKHCLSTHLLLHSADRPYKCPECSKTFTLKHHLVSHERVHTRDRPFECPECGRRFPQKRHLTTHIKFHSGERPFSCPVCGESFSREEHLVMHSRFHGGQRPFACPDCGAGFLRKFELVNHERQHGRNPESCPSCGKEFLQKRTLLVHIRTCGLPPAAPPTPPSQTPSPPRYLPAADGVHHNKTCKECGETFASMEGLALHLRLHVGDHSFLSDICSLAATLKQSAMTAAVLGNKKPHICSDCGRGFSQKHGLFQHRQRHADASCKLKPFACEKCGKCFAQKNHLYLHERQHMDKPFEPRNNQVQQQQAQQQQQQQMLQQQQQPKVEHQPGRPDTMLRATDRSTLMHQTTATEMDHRHHPDQLTAPPPPDRRHQMDGMPVSLIQQSRQGGQMDQHRHQMIVDQSDILHHHQGQQRPSPEEPSTSSCHLQQATAKANAF